MFLVANTTSERDGTPNFMTMKHMQRPVNKQTNPFEKASTEFQKHMNDETLNERCYYNMRSNTQIVRSTSH